MITFLHGRLAHSLPTQATIDVGGVGYEVALKRQSVEGLKRLSIRCWIRFIALSF